MNSEKMPYQIRWDDVRTQMLALRQSGADNHDLIQAAIKATYFTLESNPTVRGIIDLVSVPGKSPTTQTVTKHINEFNSNLRERLRVKLSLPEMPVASRELVENAMSALIESCQVAARESVEVERIQIKVDSDAKVRLAENAVGEAQARANAYQQRITQLEGEYGDLQQSYEAVLIEVAKGKGQVEEIKLAVEKLQESLNQANAQNQTLTRELELTKQHYEARLAECDVKHAQSISLKDAEIVKLAGILQVADKDLVNTRMHLQNSQAAREDLKKELDQERQAHHEAVRKAGITQSELRNEIKELSGSIGVLKGRAIAAEEQRLSFESANQMLQREIARVSVALEEANKRITELSAKRPAKKGISKSE